MASKRVVVEFTDIGVLSG